MRATLVFGLWPLTVLSAAATLVNKGFPPDYGTLTLDGKLPLSFNFTDTQKRRPELEIDGSFWANSFIHGSNGRNYYLAAHVMDYASEYGPDTPLPYRAAILDLTEPSSLYKNFIKFAPANTSIWGPAGEFRAEYPGYGMVSSSPGDPLQGIRAYTNLEGIEFDITFNFTSPALLNAALASYQVGGGIGWEWSGTKSATEGWLKVDGEVIEIVPEKSSTWYDRQWGSLQDGFQWIAMVFEDSDWLGISSMAAWDWKDAVDGPKEFGTLRDPKTGRDSTVPLTITESSTNVYVSPVTGLHYPQEWVVVLEDIEIVVKSPRPQLFEPDASTGFPRQFSGFVEVTATKAGCAPVKGHGAVDHLHPFP